MVAFPLCFPGVTTMIPGDESRVAALDVSPSGFVYGLTRGHACHLFLGMTHGATGAVVDLGVVGGAVDAVDICCGTNQVFSAVQTDRGGCIAVQPARAWPFDLLQEWSFPPKPFTLLDPVVTGEQIFGLARNPERNLIVAATENGVHRLDPETGAAECLGEARCSGRPVCLGGVFYGHTNDGVLWSWHPEEGFKPEARRLPEGDWSHGFPVWAAGNGVERCVADAGGHLYRFRENGGFLDLGKTDLTPVTAMAESRDGRLFGCCGEGIQRFFCQGTQGSQGPYDIGCGISLFQRRRYGFRFSCAAVGHDGRLFFGEDDDLGHLWIYMPACPERDPVA